MAYHPGCQLRLGRKANTTRHIRGLQPGWILGPGLGQIKRPIDKGVTMARDIGQEYADLAVRDLPGRPRVLPRHTARCFALLQKAGLINDKDRVFIGQMLNNTCTETEGSCLAVGGIGRAIGWCSTLTTTKAPP